MTTVASARSTSVEATRSLATKLAELARPGDLVLAIGDLGTGKTAFAQGFALGLGIDDPVTSPTFTLVRSYEGRMRLHHLDAYRLEHLQEIVDLGLAEIIDDGAVTLIEWGDMVQPVIPSDYLEVRLSYGSTDKPDSDDDDERVIELRVVGPTWYGRAAHIQDVVIDWAGKRAP
jgi:tRNA threonylcarbamoyladenosine biosynthesis protein TsaE